MRLLGLDPGLQVTGWGIVEARDNRLSHLANGAVRTDPSLSLADRLVQLYDGLTAVIADWSPAEAAVEETFVNKNPNSTLKLGQARGISLLAAARSGLGVFEYPPNLVKKTVVGTGHATKDQIQMMVGRLLPGCALTGADAADALACAICHAHHRATQNTIAAAIVMGGAAMIAKLTGRVDCLLDDGAIIDVRGVGYRVQCPSRVLGALAPGAAVELWIETVVREDAFLLYGFTDRADQDWFRLLTGVQGVGTKAALAILGVLDADGLMRAVAAGDKAAVSRANGVGPKLAGRVVSELKDKAGGIAQGAAAKMGVALPAAAAAAPAPGATAEATSALVNLGYGASEALAAVSRAAARLGEAADTAALIRGGLAELAPAEAR